MSNLVISGKANRVFQPLGQDNLKPTLAIDLDLAKELYNILRTAQGQSRKDEDKGLDESGGLSSSKSVSNGLQELGQEWSQAFLSSLLDKFGSKSSNLGSSIVLDRRTQESVNDVQADFQTGSAVGIVPVKDLLVVVNQNPLDCFGSRSQNVALSRLHEQAVKLRERSSYEALRKRLGGMLCQNDEQLSCNLCQVIVSK